MLTLRKWLVYSTLTSIFTESLRANFGFDFKYFYVVILINLIIMMTFNLIKLTPAVVICYLLIFFNGFFSILFGINELNYFLIQIVSIFIITLYYYSFFEFNKIYLENLVEIYCKLSLYVALIGFVIFPFEFIYKNYLFRSILLEPAHYATIVLPALFITLKNRSFPRYYSIVILISILLSGSSLALMGLGLILIFYVKRITLMKLSISILLIILLGNVTYNFYEPFRIRIDDTVQVLKTGNVQYANLSTYALLSNLFVAIESFKQHPIIGSGIGSHIISRDIYLNSLDGIENFVTMEMDHLNAQDAGSLFIRLLSETGIVGLIFVAYFIVRNYVPSSINSKNENIVCKAILLYFFAKLFREGHYFSPEMYFFVFLYYFNSINHRKKLKYDTH